MGREMGSVIRRCASVASLSEEQVGVNGILLCNFWLDEIQWKGGKQLEIFKDMKCKKCKESRVQATKSMIEKHDTIEVDLLQ